MPSHIKLPENQTFQMVPSYNPIAVCHQRNVTLGRASIGFDVIVKAATAMRIEASLEQGLHKNQP